MAVAQVIPIPPLGATSEEWAAWAQVLPHLIVPVTAGGKDAFLEGWSTRRASAQDLADWQRQGHSFGLRAANSDLVPIDVDCDDPALAAQACSLVAAMLGPLPTRYRRDSPRRAMLVRVSGPVRLPTVHVGGDKIEFLRTQLVVAGRHPGGCRYEWEGGTPTGVPIVPPERLLALHMALLMLPGARAGKAERGSSGLSASWARNATLLEAVSRPAETLTEIADALRSGVFDVDKEPDWANVLRSCTVFRGTELEEQVYELARTWSAQSAKHDDGQFEVKWNAQQATEMGPHWLRNELRRRREARSLQIAMDALAPAMRIDDDEVPPPPPCTAEEAGAMIGRMRSEAQGKKLTPTLELLMYALLHVERVRFDVFAHSLQIRDRSTWRPMADDDAARLRQLFEAECYSKTIPKEMMRDAMMAHAPRVDTAKEWIRGLRWDGIGRIADFCARYLGAASSPYATAVGRYLWTALADRALHPGCKAQMVPIFVGDQGAGKSTLVSLLVPWPEAAGEMDLGQIGHDDAKRVLRGKLVMELGELRGLRRADLETVKSWVTRSTEEWIEKFQTYTTTFKRRCVFVGTTNQQEFLNDPTGERRWLPLKVGRCDTHALVRDLPQLWAEGVALLAAEGQQWRDAETLARAEHAQFKVSDSLEDKIEDWLHAQAGKPFRMVELMEKGLFIPQGQRANGIEQKAGAILRSLGYELFERKIEGRKMRLWGRNM